MKIKDLNLENLNCKFSTDINDETEIPEMFDDNVINSFNKKVVTSDNINFIIILMKFIKIKNKMISDFVIFNSFPCKEHFNLIDINKGIYLPDFMKYGFIDHPSYLYQICNYDLLNWTKFAIYNDCLYNEFTLYIAINNIYNTTKCFNYLVNIKNNTDKGIYNEKYFSKHKDTIVIITISPEPMSFLVKC